MSSWRDRLNQFSGKTRFVVSRLFLHLCGKEVATLLGLLNQAAQNAIDSDGDIQVVGEGLVKICQSLLQNDLYWHSAANEGDVLWDEGEAGDFVMELFTDSAQRYRSALALEDPDEDSNEPFSIPITTNIVVMITVACEGDVPELETDLANIPALKTGLSTLINLHYQERFRAIQVHFSPAQFGEELTADQILAHFPELIPL